MISNLSADIHKLDLGLQIIRKLMLTINDLPQFPWVIKDISQSLNELNQIVQKNYVLRDSYYNMERDVQKSLSNYHVILRDYQYDIEIKIKEIIDKIKETMNTSINPVKINNAQLIMDKYHDKKILPIIIRLIDILQNKNWVINYDNETSDWIIQSKGIEMGKVKIQTKKATINIPSNDLTLNLHLGKDKENKQNLEIIKSL
jgi:hypothetical protein